LTEGLEGLEQSQRDWATVFSSTLWQKKFRATPVSTKTRPTKLPRHPILKEYAMRIALPLWSYWILFLGSKSWWDPELVKCQDGQRTSHKHDQPAANIGHESCSPIRMPGSGHLGKYLPKLRLVNCRLHTMEFRNFFLGPSTNQSESNDRYPWTETLGYCFCSPEDLGFCSCSSPQQLFHILDNTRDKSGLRHLATSPCGFPFFSHFPLFLQFFASCP